MGECSALTTLYANGNQIETLPETLFNNMLDLTTRNLSNNQIASLSNDFIQRFGSPMDSSGDCTKDSNCKMILAQNPVLSKSSNSDNDTV